MNSDTWSLGCCLYYLVTKKDPFEGKSIQETKHNILNLRLDPSDSLKFHDNTLVQLIYACLERDASKRMTCEEVMRYQDELEEQIFGVAVSKKHFDLQLRQTQLNDQLAQRVTNDRVAVDYTGQSLALRNNPWFFSKSYTVEPLTDDTDFYLIIETNVG